MKVFIADDDEDDVELFKLALYAITTNVDIIYSANGQELLASLKDRVSPPPDFLFLDLNMPIKTGYDCLTEIKSHPYYKEIRVVILTTSNHQKDIDITYQNGADYYLCKPSSLSVYERALKKLFSFEFNHKRLREEFVIK